jgi:RimJ/RimL family protein N-acetyltransferase
MKNNTDVIITFKPLQKEDLPLLLQWFKEPHVAQWWPVPQKEEDFFAHFLKRIRTKETLPFLVFLNNKPIGYVQYYKLDQRHRSWLPPLPEETVGTDQFIGEIAYVGKGYGTLMLKQFIQFLSQQNPSIKIIIVDPDPKNKAAIRCYEKVGFEVMGEFLNNFGDPALVMRYTIQK